MVILKQIEKSTYCHYAVMMIPIAATYIWVFVRHHIKTTYVNIMSVPICITTSWPKIILYWSTNSLAQWIHHVFCVCYPCVAP